MTRWLGHFLPHNLLPLGVWWLALAMSLATQAQTSTDVNLPARVGRLVEVQGTAWVYDRDEAVWSQAQHNRPITAGDRIGTDRGSRLELRIGSVVVRLAGETDLMLRQLDERAIVVELWAGSLALRVTSPETASQIEVTTSEGRFVPGAVGHYRVDRRGESSEATAWRGTLHFEGRDSRLAVTTGQRAEFWLQGGQTQYRWLPVEQDDFAAWVARADQDADRVEPPRYVSPEMTGWEDLERHGSWRWHPEYGRVWYPNAVPAGWAPYTLGRWTWVSPWGWTWIDVAPWGFAPFHYGRWVTWGGRWVWTPGPRAVRPIYLPATVDWVFPPHAPGHRPPPPSHWKPLPPRSDFRPHSQPLPVPRERGAVPPPPRADRPAPRPPATTSPGEVSYGDRGVPGGVVVTPRDAFAQPRPGASPPSGSTPPPAQPTPRPQPRPEPPTGASRPLPSPFPAPVMGSTPAAPSLSPSPVPPATGSRRPVPPAAPLPPGESPRATSPAMSPPPPAVPPPPLTSPRLATPPATAAPPSGVAPRPAGGPPAERGQRPEHGERAKPGSPADKPADKPVDNEADGRKRAPEQNTNRGDRKMVQ